MDNPDLKSIHMLIRHFIFTLCLLLPAGCPALEAAVHVPEAMPPHPRLLFTSHDVGRIRTAVEAGGDWAALHRQLMKGAGELLDCPVSRRIVVGRRLLDVSRETLRRILLLGYAYRLTGETKYSERAAEELAAVAEFTDWNPSHFLDVAEMTTAAAIGYDWFYEALPESVRQKTAKAIREKGLAPSFDKKYNDWLERENNWNQVCNAGMAFGALALYDEMPATAAKILQRSVESIRKPMQAYAPDGAYPEGYSYWGYGTTYNVLLIDALEKISGSDGGLSLQPGFLHTPDYILHMIAPDGDAFNFGDNSESGRLSPAMFWFARKRNDAALLWNERTLLRKARPEQTIAYRFSVLSMIWGAGIPLDTLPLPGRKVWISARSVTPVALMRTSWQEKRGIYVAFKGGSGSDSHAHLDAGSFVLVADGVRWACDSGRQDYHSLESRGIDLWNKSQDSDRWKVFRYNNLAHTTLAFDGLFQQVKGRAVIVDCSDDARFPYAVSDLTPVYAGQAARVVRGIGIVNGTYVAVRDELLGGERETTVRWTMLTPARARIIDRRTIELSRDGRTLQLRVECPAPVEMKTWDTAPATDYDAPNPGTIRVGFEAKVPAGKPVDLVVKLVPGQAGAAGETIPPLAGWDVFKKE